VEKGDVAGNRFAGRLLCVSIQKGMGQSTGGAKKQFKKMTERLPCETPNGFAPWRLCVKSVFPGKTRCNSRQILCQKMFCFFPLIAQISVTNQLQNL
jgi:hypothetical protein